MLTHAAGGRAARPGARGPRASTPGSIARRPGRSRARIEAALGDAAAIAPPVSPHVALRAALATVPIGARRRHRAPPARRSAPTTGSTRCSTRCCRVRAESGSPPPASPVGRILAAQAIQHVLHARRWTEVDERDAQPAARRVRARRRRRSTPTALRGRPSATPARRPVRAVARGGARGGRQPGGVRGGALPGRAVRRARAARCSQRLRGREADLPATRTAPTTTRRERVRRLSRLLEESDAGELTVEDGGVRITVRRREPARPGAPLLAAAAAGRRAGAVAGARRRRRTVVICVESPMVGNFYRSSSPSSPIRSCEEGDRVEVGQTLCILEAMKLFNELKSDHAGTVRKDRSCDDAEPVEFGQPLFELARSRRCSASARRQPGRDRGARDPRLPRARARGRRRLLDGRSRAAPGCALADRAVCIGPPSARESYLRSRRASIAAAEHDGLRRAAPGLRVPLGEPVVRARLRGQRPRSSSARRPSRWRCSATSRSRRSAMRAAGLPLVPGSPRAGCAARDEAAAVAGDVGYPVLLKAASGGGGRGMRLVERSRRRSRRPTRPRRPRREAAFGDGGLYLEKIVVDAHHVEVQVLGDGDGGALVRRRARVQRPAPAPEAARGVAVAVPHRRDARARCTRRRSSAVRATSYRNAGTIECLVGARPVASTSWR